jgi:lysozyme
MTILELQKELKLVGFDPGPIDGIMGPKTEAAIINFQKAKGLNADGMLGPQTLAALSSGAAVPGPAPAGNVWTQLLDVSAYQGVIDFAKVKASGYPAVAIKTTDGLLSVDPRFHDNWRDAKEAGVARFAYHYFHPNHDGAAQADFFLRTLDGDLGEIVAALDWETGGGVSAAQQIAQADAWYAKVDQVYDEAGFRAKPFAYSYSSFFAALKLPPSYAERPLWLAGYVREDRLVVPSPWRSYDIWQYAGDALSPPVEGINPRLKKDYDKYYGSIDQLIATYGK